MRGLKNLLRKRFPGQGANGIRYGRTKDAGGDTVLWQVLAGDEVLWDAGPEVKDQIPAWERLGDAAMLVALLVPGDAEGDWLVLRLP
jgi:hypothetical protein